MNFPKLLKKNIKGVGVVEIKPYLTTAIISAILDMASEHPAYSVRCALADMMVLHECTDLQDFADDEVNIDVYDVYKANGIIDTITREINGYDILISGLADLSIRDIYNRFEGAIEEFTKQFKDINLEEQQKKFEDTLSELRQVEAEKEAILNG